MSGDFREIQTHYGAESSHSPQLQGVANELSRGIYLERIHRKVTDAWGSSVGFAGFGDPEDVAGRLYYALYDPNSLEDYIDTQARASDPVIADDRLPSKVLWPTSKATLLTPLGIDKCAPSRNEFISAVTDAFLLGVDFAEAVLPGAREQVDDLLQQGDGVVIWSNGHHAHQHRKLAGAGLYDPAEVTRIHPSVKVSGAHGEPRAIPTAISSNKLAPETLAKVTKTAGRSQAIVVDDRIRNLRAFRGGVPQTRAAIWVQFGAHAENDIQKLTRGENQELANEIAAGTIIPIADIRQLSPTIHKLRLEGVLTKEQAMVVCDYDDTLSDHAKRRAMEFSAVMTMLAGRNWI